MFRRGFASGRIAEFSLGMFLLGGPALAQVTVNKSTPVNLSRSGGDVCPGDKLEYTVCINNGSTKVQNFELFQDLLPANCFATGQFVASTVPPSASDCTSGTTLCLTALSVAPGQLCLKYDGTLKNTVAAGTPCVNQADLTQGFNDILSNAVTTRISCAGSGPDLSMIKTVSPTPPVEGQPLTYTLIITNNGGGADSNVVVTDDIPDKANLSKRVVFPAGQTVSITSGGGPVAGATWNFSPPPAGAKQNGILQVNIPSIAGRQVVQIQFVVNILGTCDGKPWGFSNQAKMVSTGIGTTPRVSDNDDGDGIFPEPTASGPIVSTGTSKVTVEKIASDPNGPPLNVNDAIHYIVRFSETGGCAAADIQLQDDLPAGAPLQLATVTVPAGALNQSQAAPAGANAAGLVNVTGISVPGLGTAEVSFDGKVQTAAACTPICNRGRFRTSITNFADTNEACLTVANPGGASSVQVTKFGSPNPVSPGGTASWAVTITNTNANCSVTGASFLDDIKAQLSLIAATVWTDAPGANVTSSSGPPSGAGNGQVKVTGINVTKNGGTATITFNTAVGPSATGQVCNQGTLTVDGVPVDSNLPCLDVQAVPQCPVTPPAVASVKATKSASAKDVLLSWSATPQAATYNGYRVLSDLTMVNRALIPQANSVGAAANPTIQAVASCSGVPGLNCADPLAVVSPDKLLYYQQVGVCATGAEGPN